MYVPRRVPQSQNDVLQDQMQTGHLRESRTVPMHDSSIDTESKAQLDTMGDTLNVLLDSIGNKNSSKGSIPTDSLTLELIQNGMCSHMP